MKDFFESHTAFHILLNYLKRHLNWPEIDVAEVWERQKQVLLRQEPESLRYEQAIRCIQRLWRKRQVNKKLIDNPYGVYLSMLAEDDEPRLLSSIMFGRHAAELPPGSRYKIANPYIHTRAYYHRDDDLPGFFLERLLDEFQIDRALVLVNEYMPVTLSRSIPIETIIQNYFPSLKTPVAVIKDNKHSLGLLAIPRCNFGQILKVKEIVRACGMVASPWEIAQNIKTALFGSPELSFLSMNDLPTTKQLLLQSSIWEKVKAVAASKRHPTRILAINLIKLVQGLPEMTSEAIKRIALMLELTHTFHEYHYPRYAFCIYTIIHELSLALLQHTDEETLKNEFVNFMNESQNTMLHALGLVEGQLSNTQFVAFPAMSGTNAYALAMQLAAHMRTDSGAKPKIKVYTPHYYEFDQITPKNSDQSEADIFVISAGPIVTKDGLTPGVDVNRLVTRKLIQKNRNQPITVIIDATTALYINLRLTPAVQALVEQGQLSIIIHESHQKFGLIHSDQAQYGRVLGVCARKYYAAALINQAQENAREDFYQHVDMRIGAFISSQCGDSLEDIKYQHFMNGALLRNLLIASSLGSPNVVQHKDMLTNQEQLYFITSQHTSFSTITRNCLETRDSFGHFNSTKGGVGLHHRISADASDNIDCLLLASQIYIAQQYNAKQLGQMLIDSARISDSLEGEYQLMALALLNHISAGFVSDSQITLELLVAMQHVLNQCFRLCGRQYYMNVVEYLAKLRQLLISQYKPANCAHFIKAAEILYQLGVRIHPLIEQLCADGHLDLLLTISTEPYLQPLLAHQNAILAEKQLRTVLALVGAKLNVANYLQVLDHEHFCNGVLKIHDVNQQILTNLKTAPQKYEAARKISSSYQAECYQALQAFYSQKHATRHDAHVLVNSLEHAKNFYISEVLHHDRSPYSRIARLLLMAVVNFFAALTLGAAHAIHYYRTDRVLFFAGTHSENTLYFTHKNLNKTLGSVDHLFL